MGSMSQDPMAQTTIPVGSYTQAPMGAGVEASVASGHLIQGAAPVDPAAEGKIDSQLAVAALHNSMLPSQREMAAESLANADWRSNPAVVSELLRSAREDPAPSVRSACVRCLVKMNVRSGVAVATLQSLKNDTDAQVREEARGALAATGAEPPAPQNAVQTTSFVTPTAPK